MCIYKRAIERDIIKTENERDKKEAQHRERERERKRAREISVRDRTMAYKTISHILILARILHLRIKDEIKNL